MTEILTVTLNPALDLATSCASVSAGPKLRCGPETAEPGGGGVNVVVTVASGSDPPGGVPGQAAHHHECRGPDQDRHHDRLHES